MSRLGDLEIPPTSAVATALEGDLLVTGQELYSRRLLVSSGTLSSGLMRLGFFTARKSETVSKLAAYSSATAGTGITLARMGLYSVAADGALALIASTSNDATLFGAASTRYEKALSVPVSVVAGRRYAVGILVVTPGTAPLLACVNTTAPANSRPPVLSAVQSGLADLPAAVTGASVLANGSGVIPYAELLP